MPRRRLWPRLLIGFVVGFVLAVGLVAGGLLAFDSRYEGRVLAGVRVGDVDLSGLDRGQATAALDRPTPTYAEGQVVIRTEAGDVAVPYRDFGRRADIDSMVDAALQTGRGGTPLERAIFEVRLALSGLSIEPRVSSTRTSWPRRSREPCRRSIAPPSTAVSSRACGRLHDAADGRSDVRRHGRHDGGVGGGRTDRCADRSRRAGVARRDPAGAPRQRGRRREGRGAAHGQRHRRHPRQEALEDQGVDGPQLAPVQDRGRRDDPPDRSIDAAIAKSLKKVGKAVKVATDLGQVPQDARRARSSAWSPPRTVGALDTAATAAAIAQALVDRARSRRHDADQGQGDAQAIAPKLTTAEALKKGPVMVSSGSGRRGSRSTTTTSSARTSGSRPKIIDGTVLLPGQRFEWWSAIGPVDVGARVRAGRVHRGQPHRARPVRSAAGCARAPRPSSTPRCGRACRWARARITSTTSTDTRSGWTRRSRRPEVAAVRRCRSRTT